jgi:hypothetical protein
MYQNDKTVEPVKIIRWFAQSRQACIVCYGVDKFKNFVSKKWTGEDGKKRYNFWDIYSKHPRTAVNYDEKELKE